MRWFKSPILSADPIVELRQSSAGSLDRSWRPQLRQIIGIQWTSTVSNYICVRSKVNFLMISILLLSLWIKTYHLSLFFISVASTLNSQFFIPRSSKENHSKCSSKRKRGELKKIQTNCSNIDRCTCHAKLSARRRRRHCEAATHK